MNEGSEVIKSHGGILTVNAVSEVIKSHGVFDCK